MLCLALDMDTTVWSICQDRVTRPSWLKGSGYGSLHLKYKYKTNVNVNTHETKYTNICENTNENKNTIRDGGSTAL